MNGHATMPLAEYAELTVLDSSETISRAEEAEEELHPIV